MTVSLSTDHLHQRSIVRKAPEYSMQVGSESCLRVLLLSLYGLFLASLGDRENALT